MSAHHITRWDVTGGELLVQEVEPAETKLDAGLGTARTVRQASRALVVDLTTAQAGLRLILQMQI